MDKPGVEPTLEQLVESYEKLQSTADTVGADVIQPVLDQLQERMRQAVPVLSDADQRIIDSWQVIVDTTAELGIDPPTPTAEIMEALARTEEHKAAIKALGGIMLQNSDTQESSDQSAIPTIDQTGEIPQTPSITSAPETATDELKEPAITEASIANTTEEAPTPATEESAETEAQHTQQHVLKLSPRIREATKELLEALSAKGAGTTCTTAKLLQDIGTLTSTEIYLRKKDNAEQLPQTQSEIRGLNNKNRYMYIALKVLNEQGIVTHTKGTYKPGKSEAGQVTLNAPVRFAETEQGLTIEQIFDEPYHVTVNAYHQRIDNGRGKSHEVKATPETFAKVARILGGAALLGASEKEKITRAMMIEQGWIPDGKWAVGGTVGEMIDAFTGALPFRKHGKMGGTYYSMDQDATVEIIDGWPEKPRFDEPVHVYIKGNQVISYMDGQDECVILDFSKTSVPEFADGGADRLLARSEALFGALSLLTKATDIIHLDDLMALMPDELESSDHAVRNWVKATFDRIGLKLDEPLANWRNFGGSVSIDLNRRIIIDDDTEDPDNNIPAPTSHINEPLPAEQATTTQPESVDSATLQANTGESQASERRTATAVVEAINSLGEDTRKIIAGRLMHDGRFEYPNSIEETAYLLQLLVTDNSVRAQAREASRFRYGDGSDFQAFMAEALFACYIRTRSWGSFAELYEAVKQGEPDDAKMRNLIHSFERTTKNFIDQSSHLVEPGTPEGKTTTQYEEFLKVAANMLVDGDVPEPADQIQAIALLDAFRVHRSQIAQGRTRDELDIIIRKMHNNAARILGQNNLFEAVAGRTSKRSSGSSSAGERAVLTSGGGEGRIVRTDAHRFGDGQRRRRRPRRKK